MKALRTVAAHRAHFEYKAKSLTVLIFAALLAPLLYPFQTIRANAVAPFTPNPKIVSAAPQIYNYNEPSSLFAADSVWQARGRKFLDLFKTEPLSEGFEVAKTPSFGGKILAAFGASEDSVFGLFSASSANHAPPAPAGSVDFDFDGDGKADVVRRQSASGEWKIRNSANGSFSTFSLTASAIAAPGDYDGDGKTDAAIFSAGTWTIVKSSNGQTQTISFGQAGDKPQVGDFDGDGADDAAVFRASNSTWYVRQSSNSQTVSYAFGQTGDVPAVGNYDGDSKADIAVYRPSTGYWHVQGSAWGYFGLNWGIASDIPVPADFDGDGKTDFSVYRGATGTWYVYKSSTNNGSFLSQTWGNYGDQPVPADYDGDSKADFAVWRPATGVWHIVKSSDASYQYHTLGQAGDAAVVSAYLKQIGGLVPSYDLAKARLSPKNATGGTNLYSRNFAWSNGLVGLSGRAGLDAGFGISYNSLVWTKQTDDSNNASVYFDADNANITPGFRFGFPTIEPVYWDKTASRFNYLMVAPSGTRIEFRQTQGASDVYETADASYLQLKTVGAASPNDPVENFSIKVAGTDGGEMTYLWKAGAFRCAEIKDRNGNFITINHDEQGLLRTVTDTLGRIVTVNYDAQLHPTTITQTWKTDNGAGSNQTHTWAAFSYTTKTINTNFASSVNVVGPPNGTILKVLQKITYPGGGSVVFDYNDYGQVWKIRSVAADSASHVLTQIRNNLENPAANQTDCPRFSETRNWTENFNGGNEIVVTNSIQTGQSYNVGGHTGTATKIEVAMANHPHGAVSKTFVGESGWMEGLPVAAEDWANGTSGIERKRWTWTNWTQDDTNSAETLNPRVTESKVGDTTNTKRTTTDYYTVPLTNEAVYGLVKEVKIYDSDQTTVLKKAVTEYNLAAVYTSRRIIGLPSKTEVYGLESSGLNLVSKVTYAYDEENFTHETNQIIAPIQHDAANFGASFVAGRGNPTSVTRWNVEYPASQSEAVTSKMRYDIAGSPVAAIDPLGRKVRTEYADAFNDNQNRNAFAYPTKLIDPANNFSIVKYRFDTGASVFAESPAPAGNTSGKETARIYDGIGRLEKETLVNTGAYTRYEYPANGIQSKAFSTVVDTDGDGADADDEVYSESWTDGAGRTLRARTEHPNSIGGFSGTLTEYDTLGQVKRSSVPTEINQNYIPAGDDEARGWLWTSAEYDWMGRTVREINTDGTDKLYSYDGCGCAGGQITTVRSELVPRDDQPTVNARRTQKIYADILGRSYKTEVLNWDGAVYSTNLVSFNGRDQAVSLIEQDNSQAPVVSQTTAMTYDGHGRLKTRHLPQQNANAATAYNYNADDGISSVTDARGASVNYSYNSRGLVEQIAYGVPQNSNIPVTASVSFQYDALGNRTQMTDGLGNITYEYDQLSQLTAETRQFSDSLPDAPLSNNRFKIEYGYTFSGRMKSLKDPYGQQFNYAFDKAGRLASVAGATAFDGITDYADNPAYNARGLLTKLEYGNGTEMAITGFNNRLQATGFEVKKGTDFYIKKQYQFFTDGSLKFIDDTLSEVFDRSYKYDHLGRTTEAKAGKAARGETSTDPHKIDQPYSIAYQHDAFGHIKQINANHYAHYNSTSYAYTNGRNSSWTYDAEGNIVSDADGAYKYDAAGRTVSTTATDVDDESELLGPTTSHFDGDGQLLKRVKTFGGTPVSTQANYFIRSTALGKVVSEANQTGKKTKTFVPANGTTLAEQKTSYWTNTPDEHLRFIHQDASATGMQMSESDGTIPAGQARTGEYDPLGRNIADVGLYIVLNTEPPQGTIGGEVIDLGNSGAGYRPGRRTYTMDGLPVTEAVFMDEVYSGRIGGAFGLLEMSARMSVRFGAYSLKFRNGETSGWYATRGEAISRMEGGETLVRNWFVNDSWSVVASLTAYSTTLRVDDIPKIEVTRPTATDLVAAKALEFLNDATNACVQALKNAGMLQVLKDKLKKGIKIISVSENSGDPAVKYTHNANIGENLGDYFNRILANSPYTDKYGMAIGTTKAIISYEGASAFINGVQGIGIKESEKDIKYFIHELTHHAGLGDDLDVADALNLILPQNPTNNDASVVVSDYFNKGCPTSMVKPPPPVKGGKK